MRGTGRRERGQERDTIRGQKRRRERGRSRGREREHDVDGEGDGAGTRAGVEGNEITQDGNENERREQDRGEWRRGEYAQENLKELDVMRKTGETWAEAEKNKTRKYWFSSCQPR